MSVAFLDIFQMSITASYLVFAVIILRFIFKKAPKKIIMVLWGLVALRLSIPFRIESFFSAVPQEVSEGERLIAAENLEKIKNSVIVLTEGSENLVFSENSELFNIYSILPLVWISGIVLMLGYFLLSYLKIKNRVKESIILTNNIYLSDKINDSFILGFIKPKIYIPIFVEDEERKNIIAHEKAHIKGRDYIIKPIGFLLLTFYWINPVMWAAYYFLCKDIELACDERVLKTEGIGIKKSYSNTLINCSVTKRTIAACPLAFGGADVNERVRNVLNYKKPALIISVAAILTVAITAVLFLTNPTSSKLSNETKIILENTVKSENQTAQTDDNYVSIFYEILETKKSVNKTTVYFYLWYSEYSNYNGFNEEVTKGVPAVIEIYESEKNESKVNYIQIEENYNENLRKYFPVHLRDAVSEIGRECFVHPENEKSAKKYFNINGTETFSYEIKEKYSSRAEIEAESERLESVYLQYIVEKNEELNEQANEIYNKRNKELYYLLKKIPCSDEDILKEKERMIEQDVFFEKDFVIYAEKMVLDKEEQKKIYEAAKAVEDSYKKGEITIDEALFKLNITMSTNLKTLYRSQVENGVKVNKNDEYYKKYRKEIW